MTVVDSGPKPGATTKEQQPVVQTESWRERIPTWWLAGGVIVGWIVIWAITKGTDTLVIGGQETTRLMDWLQDRSDAMQLSQSGFFALTRQIGDFLNWLVEQLQLLFSQPDLPWPYPRVGWLGVTAIAGWIALALAGWRYLIMTVAAFVSFGLLGYWADSIDTLIITGVAVVIAVVIGMPFAIWIGNSKKAMAVVTPILDFLQTFPSFTYLFPLFILFGLGAACAVMATLLYAFPPMVRIAGYGVQSVSVTSLEATRSLGQTKYQEIVKVQLPLAKRTIIVGINQTIMAALSMVIIAAYIDSPGLGVPVLQALTIQAVGKAFVPGLAIVIMAIMLDRTTTAISERSEKLQRSGGGNPRARLMGVGAGGLVTVVCIYLSHSYTWAAGFPSTNIGPWLAERVQTISDWVSTNLSTETEWIANFVSYKLLNPLQNLIANSPWYVTFIAIVLLGAVLGGRWAALAALVCLAGLHALGLWDYSMITLTMTLVATAFVMILAMVFGVWMGRSNSVDLVLRPWLDAGQTMPAFVYLIPVLALFGPTRFTAIVAAIVYAAPAAIKIVADGIRAVSVTTIEAAVSTGSNRWQIIRKVQVPMAKGAVLLATNQGLLYVLSMVVIGGLVGAGALGYDIVRGISQGDFAGRGLAASFSVVLIGVMLDRISRRAATRATS